MRTASFLGATGSAFALALATVACTILSGVDDMELRPGPIPGTPDPDAAASDGLSPPSTDGAAPDDGSKPKEPPSTGPLTCKSQGSWTTCSAMTAITTCGIECSLQGLACVDSCCATDDQGAFDAKVGMVYALASECSINSMPSNAAFGLCADATIVGSVIGQIRCCCK